MNNKQFEMGLKESDLNEAEKYPELFIGRIISQYNNLYRILTENNELTGEVSGSLRHSTENSIDFPAVGDFVMIDRDDRESGNAIIHHVLKRKSIFVRKSAGTSNTTQVIAANIDTVFVCMSLNRDFNLRRLERYLSIAWDSGAIPVIVLTKSDLCDDLDDKLLEISTVAFGVDTIVTTSVVEEGYKDIKKYLLPDQTIAFIGSSGVGKSTLINCLLGKEFIKTNKIRLEDDKGRHTTTRRELITIPGMGMVIDTPGMREIGVENTNLSMSFADISNFAENCRFSDCSHINEPQCAVKKAIKEGLISQERFDNFTKLQKEAKYDGLNSKQIEKEKVTSMFSDFDSLKDARNYIKKSRDKKK